EPTVSILIRPNSTGKTTLINVISGLYNADSAKVFCESQDVTGYPPLRLYKLRIGRTFQIPALFWKLTVLENLLVAERNNPGESFFKSLNFVGLRSWKDFFGPWRDTSSGWQMIHGLKTMRGLIRDRAIMRKLFRRKAL